MEEWLRRLGGRGFAKENGRWEWLRITITEDWLRIMGAVRRTQEQAGEGVAYSGCVCEGRGVGRLDHMQTDRKMA